VERHWVLVKCVMCVMEHKGIHQKISFAQQSMIHIEKFPAPCRHTIDGSTYPPINPNTNWLAHMSALNISRPLKTLDAKFWNAKTTVQNTPFVHPKMILCQGVEKNTNSGFHQW
jgi:hypothetical protein